MGKALKSCGLSQGLTPSPHFQFKIWLSQINSSLSMHLVQSFQGKEIQTQIILRLTPKHHFPNPTDFQKDLRAEESSGGA